MKRVTGLGGVFFKSQDPTTMNEWYRKHLGIEAGDGGAMFEWRDLEKSDKVCSTVWSTFPDKTKYFEPSQKEFMLNYRVENLEGLLEVLRKEGVTVVGGLEKHEYGKFGWIMDPEGNKIELWEPPDEKV